MSPDTNIPTTPRASSEPGERYQALFTHAPFPIALVRADDNIICDANEAHEKLLGYPRDELIGRTAIEAGLWVDPAQRDLCMAEFRRDGFVHEFATTVRTRSGELRRVLLSLRPMEIRGQKYMAFFLRDITEPLSIANALRQSESLLRTLLNALPDPVWLKDAQGRFLAVNSAWSRFLGIEADQAVGKSTVDLFPAEIAAELSRQDEQIVNNPQVIQIDELIPGFDGVVRQFETTKATALDGGVTIGSVGIARDVTARKQSELELAAKSEGYEARLRSLTIEASLAEERERRNLAGLLHDDVCQLLAVAGMKLALARQTEQGPDRDDLTADVEDLIARTNRAARSLMLQLSHPALYDLGIAAAAEWLAEDIQRLYGMKVSFIDDALPKPLALPLRVVLFQCLRELLVNAAKHAGVEKVDVRLTRDGDRVRVIVHDAGKGFDPQTIESRAARGFGFFSVRTRLSDLGGSMDLVSAPGEGTTVTLELPVQTEDAANG